MFSLNLAWIRYWKNELPVIWYAITFIWRQVNIYPQTLGLHDVFSVNHQHSISLPASITIHPKIWGYFSNPVKYVNKGIAWKTFACYLFRYWLCPYFICIFMIWRGTPLMALGAVIRTPNGVISCALQKKALLCECLFVLNIEIILHHIIIDFTLLLLGK